MGSRTAQTFEGDNMNFRILMSGIAWLVCASNVSAGDKLEEFKEYETVSNLLMKQNRKSESTQMSFYSGVSERFYPGVPERMGSCNTIISKNHSYLGHNEKDEAVSDYKISVSVVSDWTEAQYERIHSMMIQPLYHGLYSYSSRFEKDKFRVAMNNLLSIGYDYRAESSSFELDSSGNLAKVVLLLRHEDFICSTDNFSVNESCGELKKDWEVSYSKLFESAYLATQPVGTMFSSVAPIKFDYEYCSVLGGDGQNTQLKCYWVFAASGGSKVEKMESDIEISIAGTATIKAATIK